MAKTQPPKEGRVNVPLGDEKERLRKLAEDNGTTETNLGRVLLLEGIRGMESGELVFRGPSIESANLRRVEQNLHKSAKRKPAAK